MNRHKEKTIYSALLLIIILILLITAIVGLLLLRPAHTMLQGQVEADQIRISGILGGRVMQLMVEEGDRNIYREYITFRKYKGKVIPSLELRRRMEFELLYIP